MTQGAAPSEARPFCSETARAAGEPLDATASRVEHWLLVEYAGHWPSEPLDAGVFAGRLRGHLASQLDRLPHSRLFLVKRPGRRRGGAGEEAAGARVVYGTTSERGGRFRTLAVGAYPDLLGLDLAGVLLGEAEPVGEPLEHPLLLICTHGIRDRCCARYGQALCRPLLRRAPRDWVWQTTHVGGDRFAGNVVALPEGLYFGRVEPEDVDGLVASYLAGRIDLGRYRGRSTHGFPEQAADAHVRRATGLAGLHDVRLLSRHRLGAGRWRVELLAELAGVVHEVDVERVLGEPELLTCKASEPRRPRRFVVRGHREREVVGAP